MALVVTSLTRGVLGLRAWRAVHQLAYASWPVAVAHGLGTGTDTLSPWMLASDAACILAVAMALVARFAAEPRDRLAPARARFRERVGRPETGGRP